ncbi:histone, partial [Neisseria gonorrhoeae]
MDDTPLSDPTVTETSTPAEPPKDPVVAAAPKARR